MYFQIKIEMWANVQWIFFIVFEKKKLFDGPFILNFSKLESIPYFISNSVSYFLIASVWLFYNSISRTSCLLRFEPEERWLINVLLRKQNSKCTYNTNITVNAIFVVRAQEICSSRPTHSSFISRVRGGESHYLVFWLIRSQDDLPRFNSIAWSMLSDLGFHGSRVFLDRFLSCGVRRKDNCCIIARTHRKSTSFLFAASKWSNSVVE